MAAGIREDLAETGQAERVRRKGPLILREIKLLIPDIFIFRVLRVMEKSSILKQVEHLVIEMREPKDDLHL